MDFFTWLIQSSVKPIFWFQPAFYTLHGWLATEMALWMLFHPYEPKYIPGTPIKLPFTPGIFPRGRHKLSVSIANTITEILLTRDDIKKQAEKLITEDNIYATLDALADSISNELKDINHLRQLSRYIESLLPPLVEKLSNDYIASLETGDQKHFTPLVEQALSRIIPHVHLNQSQADFLASALLEHLITPARIRQFLIETLTEDTASLLEETLRAQLGGLQGFLIRFVDIKGAAQQFRTFLMDSPQDSEVLIAGLIEKCHIKPRLISMLLQFSPQHLPQETLEDLKRQLTESLRRALINHRPGIVALLKSTTEEATHTISSSLLNIDDKTLTEKWLPHLKRDLAKLTYTYLHKELENMLSKALPAISLNTVIIEKIDQFSAKQLEETIQRICHRELRWLAFLGAFLGFWLGLLSNFIAYWGSPLH